MNILIQQLVDRLEANDPTLTEMSLGRIPLFEISADEIQAMVTALTHNTHVTCMDLWLPDFVQPSVLDTLEPSEGLLGMSFRQTPSRGFGLAALHHAETVTTQQPNNELAILHDDDQEHMDYSFIQKVFSSNESLTKVSVSDATAPKAWQELFRSLQKNTSITTLQIGEATLADPIKLNDQDCNALCELLQRTKTLQSLSLRGIQVSQKGAMELAKGLLQTVGQQTLGSFTLHQVLVQDDNDNAAIRQMLAAIKLSSIHTLEIIECDWTFESLEEDCRHPLTVLLSFNYTLQELRMIDAVDVDVGRPLALGLVNNTCLEILDLQHNELSIVSCEALADVLVTNKSIQQLVLEETDLNDQGIAILAKGLRLNRGLRKLNLRGLQMTAVGCRHLCDALKHHPLLQVLDVSENAIGDSGAVHFGRLLANQQCPLKKFWMESALVGSDGLTALFQSLKHNRHLTTLRLGQNHVTEEAATELADLLISNAALQALDLSACHISDEVLAIMLKRLQSQSDKGRRLTLQTLSLAFNKFGNSGAKALGGYLGGGSCRLQRLELQFNAFDSVGLRHLVHGLEHNYYLQHLFVLNASTFTKDTDVLLQQLSHVLALNRAGRRIIPHQHSLISKGLWANVLTKADNTCGPTAVYHILLQCVDSVVTEQHV